MRRVNGKVIYEIQREYIPKHSLPKSSSLQPVKNSKEKYSEPQNKEYKETSTINGSGENKLEKSLMVENTIPNNTNGNYSSAILNQPNRTQEEVDNPENIPTTYSGRKKRTGIKFRGSLSTHEARKEYQRRYYQLNKEKAKEYQRQYNLTHKKKARIGRGKGSDAPREVIRTTFSSKDLENSPPEKVKWMLDKILNEERFFTINLSESTKTQNLNEQVPEFSTRKGNPWYDMEKRKAEVNGTFLGLN